MNKQSNKLRTWVIRCESGGMVYRTEDGLAKVCRYKTKTAALKDVKTFVSGRTVYLPKFVRRAKVREEEKILNWRRNTPHARTIRTAEDHAAIEARKFIEQRDGRTTDGDRRQRGIR